VIVRFNASASGTTPTLNVEGTGAKTIKNQYGDELASTQKPVSGLYAFLIYDADLDCWLKDLGDSTGSAEGLLDNGVPPEIMVALCNELNCDPWFVQPYMTGDDPSDYMGGLATYVKANLNPSLTAWYEPPNEIFNTATGFYQTRYAWNKAFAWWGVNFDHLNWYGKIASTMAQTVRAIDPRCRVVAGHQTYGSAATSSEQTTFIQTQTARLESTRYVADGGSAAKNHVTDICIANYWGLPNTLAEELVFAQQYDDTGSLEGYVNTSRITDVSLASSPAWQYQVIYRPWRDYADGYVKPLTAYEGGYSPDLPTSGDLVAERSALRLASKADPGIKNYTAADLNNFAVVGVSPSTYMLCGPSQPWSMFDPTIYDTPSPQWDAIVEFNNPRRRHAGKPRKYVVEVEGKNYQVESLDQARELLKRKPRKKYARFPKIEIELGEISRIEVKRMPLVKALTLDIPLPLIEQAIDDYEEEIAILL
jgi:hypothetical protein